MNALKPRPPFQVLVMSEESRLGREQIETAYALKQITDAGVRVFFYLEDRERTLDSVMDKVMLSLTNFAAEMEREKGRQRTYDAMLRKAAARQVAGGMVYGYDNVEVLSRPPARTASAGASTCSAGSTKTRRRSCAESSRWPPRAPAWCGSPSS
jgi:DNA invertase Pin-like site-specific DNA recombinase